MALHPSRPTLMVLGLFKRLSGGGDTDTHDTGDAENSGGFNIDDLVEAGEDVFEEFQAKLKDTRDRIHGDVRDGVRKLLADFGVATRDEIRDLREEISRDKSPGEQ